MKWRGIYGLLFSVFLLFSFSLSLSAEVVLADEEYETILNELKRSAMALIEQENQISELQNILKHSEIIIEMLKDEQNISSEIISLLKMESDLQLKSLKEQKNVQKIHDLKIFSFGFLTGFAGGNFTGIKIGVTL